MNSSPGRTGQPQTRTVLYIEDQAAAGASGFLPKPFDIHDFLTLIDRYLL